MRRPHLVAIAIVTAALCFAWASEPPGAAAATRTITYTTQELGAVDADYAGFRRIVAATLDDPRGWSLNGPVDFRPVRDGGRLTVALASPAAIEGFGACSAYYSCRVGDLVLINSDRWRHATDSYRGQALLHSYRQMVINHEVGHALGFGHADCARPGAPAAVMQQQSKGLGGCERNPWPLGRERSEHAARIGTRAPVVPSPFAPGRRSSHVELGAPRSSVLATLGRPQRRRDGDVRTGVYARPRVTVAYARGRVAAITTRSREDVGAGGVAIGRRPARRILRRCSRPVDASRCVLASRGSDGGRTTLLLRAGRVAAMRVEDVEPGPPRTPGPRRSRPARPVIPSLLLGATTNGAVSGPCAWWWAGAGRCRPATG